MADRPKEDSEPNKSEPWTFWKKDWWRAWPLPLYVTLAYWVLVSGAAITNNHCFEKLKPEADRLLDQLLPPDELLLPGQRKPPHKWNEELNAIATKKSKRDQLGLDDTAIEKAERLMKLHADLLAKPRNSGTPIQSRRASDTEKAITILNDGPSSFSSASPCYLLIVFPGFLVFFLALIVVNHDPSPYRAVWIVLLFLSMCCGIDALERSFMGLKTHPSFTVLLTAFYFVGVFWFMDRIVFNNEFEEALKVAARDPQKCTSLYDFATFFTKLVGTMFLAICIVQGWQLSTAHKHMYENADVTFAQTVFSAVLIFYGCLGWLGGVGLVSGKRAWEAAQAAVGVEKARTDH